MNNIKTVGLTVVILVGVFLAWKGLGYQYAEHQVNNGQTYQAPADFKAEVMEGCLGTGGEVNRSYCGCAVDYMQTTLGDARMQAVALEYVQTNTTPPEMTEAAEACVHLYVPVEEN